MQTKRKLMLMLLTLSLCQSCSSTIKKTEIREPFKVDRAETAKPTCDEVLQSCTVVVEKQREALTAKDKVIADQDGLLATKDQQIDNSRKETNLWKIISAVLATILAIKLL
jgi:hypothetical protein